MGICSRCSKANVQRTCTACAKNFCPDCFNEHDCHGRLAPTI